MKHCRSDWDGIQDAYQDPRIISPSSSIEEDEPVFVLRAKDPAAGATVFYWAAVVEEQGGSPELVARVRKWSTEMAEWRQKNHPDKLVADTPLDRLR